jgi:predicted HAD superfamily Cof-like phosphohydrolase
MRSDHQKRIDMFMRLAGQEVPSLPALPAPEIRKLRASLILEEALETIDALGCHVEADGEGNYWIGNPDGAADLALAIDGCADLSVVTIGTLTALGVDDQPVLRLVDDNNLAKFGPGGHRDAGGKWIKPPGHKPPDIVAEIYRQVEEKEELSKIPAKHCPRCGVKIEEGRRCEIGGIVWCSQRCWSQMMGEKTNEQSCAESNIPVTEIKKEEI